MRKALIVAAALALTACGPGISGYSDGYRVGTIQKFSHKGLIFKTWEGEMAMEGVTVSSSDKGMSFKATWEFTVRDPELVAVVKEAMDSGKRVKMTYDQHILTGPSWDSTYAVTKVEVLK